MNRVLIVDDEQEMLDLVGQMVDSLGFTPLTAKNATEAMDVFHTEKPGIVISDLRLNGDSADGVAVCSRIRYEDNSVALICMSGHFDEYDRIYVLACGFQDFLKNHLT